MFRILILFRSVLRQLGLTKFLVKLVYPKDYEKNFDNALIASIEQGDTVWDVGANIGFYTRKFAHAVGSSGKVIAFEPVDVTFNILKTNLSDVANVRFINAALGQSDGQVEISVNEEDGSPTNRISNQNERSGDTAVIAVRSCDSVISEAALEVPNVIKIDVEGYEGEVIRGASQLLENLQVRVIAIEIHFAILAENGNANTPEDIQSILRSHGFTIKWTDPSHIIASRN